MFSLSNLQMKSLEHEELLRLERKKLNDLETTLQRLLTELNVTKRWSFKQNCDKRSCNCCFRAEVGLENRADRLQEEIDEQLQTISYLYSKSKEYKHSLIALKV